MKVETVLDIIDDMKRSENDDSSFTRNQLEQKYNQDEIVEALAGYAQFKDIEVRILNDAFVGGVIINYEQRTGKEIDKDGFIEELVICHFLCHGSNKDLYIYNEEKLIDALDISVTATMLSADDILTAAILKDMFGN